MGTFLITDDYLRRLRRIEGQARGLQCMVDGEKYFIDILTRVSATTRGLQSVALGVLDDHLTHGVVDAAAAWGYPPPWLSNDRAFAFQRLALEDFRSPQSRRAQTAITSVVTIGSSPS